MAESTNDRAPSLEARRDTTPAEFAAKVPAADHAITIETVPPGGTHRRAWCLCGWQSELLTSRPKAAEAGEAHIASVPASATDAALSAQLHRALQSGGADTVEDLGVEFTDEGLRLSRPAWCGTTEQWHAYRDAVAGWWEAYWADFRAGRDIEVAR